LSSSTLISQLIRLICFNVTPLCLKIPTLVLRFLMYYHSGSQDIYRISIQASILSVYLTTLSHCVGYTVSNEENMLVENEV